MTQSGAQADRGARRPARWPAAATEERPEPAAPAQATATPAAAGGSPAGSFPDRPQFVDDFAQAGSGWPRSGYRAGGFHLRRREGTVGALAPRSVDPANRGTLARGGRRGAARRRRGPALPRLGGRPHGLRAAARRPLQDPAGAAPGRCRDDAEGARPDAERAQRSGRADAAAPGLRQRRARTARDVELHRQRDALRVRRRPARASTRATPRASAWWPGTAPPASTTSHSRSPSEQAARAQARVTDTSRGRPSMVASVAPAAPSKCTLTASVSSAR